jgi:hypothetical protein
MFRKQTFIKADRLRPVAVEGVTPGGVPMDRG